MSCESTRARSPINSLGARPSRSLATGPWTDEEWTAYWERWDALAAEIGKTWPKGVSAVDAIREDRSRLDAYGDPREP